MPSGSCEKEEPRHVILANAISRIDNNVGRLEDLVSKVAGDDIQESPTAKAPSIPCPPLAVFLDTSYEKLNGLSDRLVIVENRLNSMLF